MVTAAQLQDALAECQRTYSGPGACWLPEYLEARKAYHRLLVEAGRLDPKLADGARRSRW